MARCEIIRENDFINISGDFLYSDLFFLLANIHKAVEDRGFSDLTLNFKGCTSAYAQEMVVLCAQIIAKRQNGIYIHLNLPEDEQLQKLFQNANWANLIDPRRYEAAPNTFYSAGHIPATQYTSSNEQFTIVNKIVDNILGAIPDMKREDFSAFEWAINEITDNVLTHAQSSVGGVVALSLSSKKKKVNYVVADAGLGIATTLRSGEHKGISDVHGLQMAIREGVTRDRSIGQGNGLFGSYEISQACNGVFRIRSGHADLYLSSKRELKITSEKILYNGTMVAGEIDFSIPGLLADALKFGGQKSEVTYDFIDAKYSPNEEGKVLFVLRNEAVSFGSRPAGTPIRNKLRTLCDTHDCKKILVDLEGIPILSSSFADEAFGKLFKEIGPLEFMSKIEFINVMGTCKNLINKAIAQRMGTG